jgi:hypothetical protein
MQSHSCTFPERKLLLKGAFVVEDIRLREVKLLIQGGTAAMMQKWAQV